MAKPRAEFPIKDLTGNRYDKLVVLKFSHWELRKNNKEGKEVRREFWLCQCDCGKQKAIVKGSFTHGTKSCGCAKIDSNIRYSKVRKDTNQSAKVLYRRYAFDAKKRNYPFELNLQQFMEITSKDCYLCGEKPSRTVKNKAEHTIQVKPYIYNGIDRLDNNVGYIYSNCQPCCRECNVSKMDIDIRTYIAKMRKIISRLDSNEELLSLVSEDSAEYKILD